MRPVSRRDDARALNDDANAHFFGILEGRMWCTFATICALLCAAGSLVAQTLNWLFKAYDVREVSLLNVKFYSYRSISYESCSQFDSPPLIFY